MSKNIVTYKGKLKFNLKDRTAKHVRQSSWKKTCAIILRDDSCDYYRWLIEKRFPFIQGLSFETELNGSKHADTLFHWINLPLRGPHMTVINDKLYDSRHSRKRTQDYFEKKWKEIVEKYDGQEVEFSFDVNDLRTNAEQWWFKVSCPMADKIRAELGIGDPFYGYHFTVGNISGHNSKIIHAEYIHNLYKRGFLK